VTCACQGRFFHINNKECEAFVKESQDLFEMLEKRIKFEESKFYPLAEKA